MASLLAKGRKYLFANSDVPPFKTERHREAVLSISTTRRQRCGVFAHVTAFAPEAPLFLIFVTAELPPARHHLKDAFILHLT
ncbi:hypothetical protein [Paraburkholderia mimosarum]|uniref:hypothetical protein n=1 Tax=Paraburkholderia mimosarum TaxID=312026 RepID=UPI0012DD20CE|nr:hypothetical protein [Paraburkholderia mimosarum]